MKFAFPLVAVLVMAGFFWASIFNAMLPDNFHVDRSVLQDGKLIMSDPVLTGQNATGAVYRVTAQRAIQALSNPNDVRLENIKGSFPLSDGKFARLEAKSATLDRSANVITFDEPFSVETQAGMTARMQERAVRYRQRQDDGGEAGRDQYRQGAHCCAVHANAR